MFASRIMFRITIVGFIIGALAAPAFAKPQSSQNLQKSLQAIYHRMDQAWDNKNVEGYAAFYDPDFVCIDVDKNVTYLTQVRQTAQFAFGEDRDIHMTTTVEKVQPWKNGVLVVDQTLGKWITDGGTLHMKIIDTAEDYWVKSGGVWKLKEENELSILTWHNGVPYEK